MGYRVALVPLHPPGPMTPPDLLPTRPGALPAEDHPFPGDAVHPLLARLDSIDRRLARIEPVLDALGQAPAMAAAVVDVVDEQTGRLRERGVDLDERLAGGLALLERLSDPAMVARVDALLDLADQAPGLASMAMDIVDEQAGLLRDDGIDPGAALANGARTALQFASMVGPREIHALKTVLASQALSPESVEVVSAAAQALVECQGRERQRVGVFALLRALREPDVQRALDFVIGVTRRFGAALESGPPSAAVVRQQADRVGVRPSRAP